MKRTMTNTNPTTDTTDAEAIFERATGYAMDTNISDVSVDYDEDVIRFTHESNEWGDEADRFAVNLGARYRTARHRVPLHPLDSRKWAAVMALPMRVPGDEAVVLSGAQLPAALRHVWLEIWRNKDTQEIWGERSNGWMDRIQPVPIPECLTKAK